jgi:AraC-like DNA-binding protein
MSDPTISVLLLRHIANCVELTGRPCQPLLSQLDLDQADLEDRDAAIPLRSFLRFFELAADYLENVHFGLQAGRLAGSDSLGPLSFLFLSAPTLDHAFSSFVRYLETMQQAARNTIEVQNGTATFEYQILDHALGVRRQDAEYSLGATYTLAKNFCGGRLPLREVCFEHTQAGDYAVYRDFFGCEVFFEQSSNAITFDAEYLDLHGRSLSPELFPILVDHLQRKAVNIDHTNHTMSSLCAWLAACDVSQPLNLGDAAKAIGLPVQSLQRRLQQAGTSWRELLHRRRIEAAKRMLLESRRSVADIAVATGYAESASFIRAFKNETGVTPARYRSCAPS